MALDPRLMQMQNAQMARERAMGPPPPRPPGIGGPEGAGPQQAQMMQRAMQARRGMGDPGRPGSMGQPPPGVGGPPQRLSDAPGAMQGLAAGAGRLMGGRPPLPGMGMQAAGFNPRQAPPAGQFAQRFPGAQAPRPPQAGGAFGMRPPPAGGGQFGAPTKRPMMAGQLPQFGGGNMMQGSGR